VKARNMSSCTVLLFTFLACTDWLEVWLVTCYPWCPEDCCCWRSGDCCWCCCSEMRRAVAKIYLVLCISRRISSLQTPVLSPAGNGSLLWWRKGVFTVPFLSNGWRLLLNYPVMSWYAF
jgi:hypothetical protein